MNALIPCIPVGAIKGRGTPSDMAHRFQRLQREEFDDGWTALGADGGPFSDPDEDGGPAPAGVRPTQWRWETARSALTRNRSPDVPFDLSLNPYRGCEHGCIYCYARPTHGYLDMSPGLDFETRLVAKRNVAEVLRHELQSARYQPGLVALGTVTDAYQPLDRRLRLSRDVLQVLADARHPVAIITKSSGVERDIDILANMARDQLAAVYVTITTLDPVLARCLEPRAPSPLRRLRTIRALADAGVPVGVSVAPQIPFLNEDMEQVLQAAASAGATRAFYTVLRLPWEVAPLFREWLVLHHPERAERVMARVQDLRGGSDHNSQFGLRMTGQGPWAELLRQRFHRACQRWGLAGERQPLSLASFRPGAGSGQGELF